MINHDLNNHDKITQFFNFVKIKITQVNTIIQINNLMIQLIILHKKMKKIIIKIINDFIKTKDLTVTTLINEIFPKHIKKLNKQDYQEIIHHHTILFFNHKTQSKHNSTNQLKCITKFHCRINSTT